MCRCIMEQFGPIQFEIIANSMRFESTVRQENERIQESMNRGKYVRNMTHAAFIGGQQYQQQSQQP